MPASDAGGLGSVTRFVAGRSAALAPLAAAIRDLIAWLAAVKAPHVLIGGLAASILGRPRLTGDVAALIWLDDGRWPQVVEEGTRFGIRPRRADALAFAQRTRVLLLRHEPSAIDLDVSVGALPFERESITRARKHRIAGMRVPIVSPADLIVMKAVAHRPRDLADIEGVLATHPRLDRKSVIRLVREFADVLEAPELLDDLRRLLRKRPGRSRR